MTIESNIEESESGIEAVGFEAEEDVGNQWVVDSPEIEDKSDEGPMPEGNFLESENYKSEERNPLESELEGWGIQMPGVIGTGNKCHRSNASRD